jgi:hypothetical protein
MNSIKLNKHPVYFSKMMLEDNSRKYLCSLSKKYISLGEEIYLIITNGKLFPNCMILAKFIDDLGFRKTTQKLLRSWIQAQKYAHWFEVLND